MVCAKGHSFDIARSGYMNVLQPQDRRSRQPGDSAAAVTARRRLHDLGVTGPLLREVSGMLGTSPQDTVLDAGCGEGFYLGSLAAHGGFEAAGMDISLPAIEVAVRRYPDCQWIVANADRFVPYDDQSFSVVLSITARMNEAEFRRVLRHKGRLLVAVPAPDDLIELRGAGRDRVARTLEAFSTGFKLLNRQRATTGADLDSHAIGDLRSSIYRPIQTKPAEAMRVTFSLDLLLFEAV
jgi:23S rRNA (guanine745-N1)-methyltransferase